MRAPFSGIDVEPQSGAEGKGDARCLLFLNSLSHRLLVPERLPKMTKTTRVSGSR